MTKNKIEDEARISLQPSGAYFNITDPTIRTLQESIDKKEWFAGIVFAATFLEHFGSHRLRESYRDTFGSDDLLQLGLKHIAMLLFASKIIDDSIYRKMTRINSFRNKSVHGRLGKQKALRSLGIDPTGAEQIIEEAIECLNALGVH